MGWQQDAENFFNGRSISDGFNQLKDDFLNFLNSTAKDASGNLFSNVTPLGISS